MAQRVTLSRRVAVTMPEPSSIRDSIIAAAHPGLIRFEGLEGPCVSSVFLVMQRDVRPAPRIRATADFLVSTLGSRMI